MFAHHMIHRVGECRAMAKEKGGGHPCIAVAELRAANDVLPFFGWSSRAMRCHAEEMIVANYLANAWWPKNPNAFAALPPVAVRIQAVYIYVDLAPCDGRYIGHRYADFFKANGKDHTVTLGNALRTVRVEFASLGDTGEARYMFECPLPGERSDIYELSSQERHAIDSTFATTSGTSLPEAKGFEVIRPGEKFKNWKGL